MLALGAVHVPAMLAVGSTAMLTMGLLAWRGKVSVPGPAVVLLGLAVYTALQAVPLPASWLTAIAPINADVWLRALRPFGESPPAWAPISVEPGATVMEALKWSTYAAVFAISGAVARRAGFRWVALIVFGAACGVALVTLTHGLLGATRVYGFHEPSQPVARWSVAPLVNPNNLSGYLNLGVFAGLGILLSRRESVALRSGVGLGLALIVAISVLSGSRAGLVALVLGVMVLQLSMVVRRWREARDRPSGAWLALGLPGLLATAGGIALAALAANETTLEELTDRSAKKLELFSWTRPLISAHPWWGVGRGAFEGAFAPYRGSGGPTSFTHAENFLADWAAGWGIPVTVIGIAVLAWSLGPKRLQVSRGAIRLSCYIGAGVLVLQNLADLALEVPAVAVQVATVFGGLAAGPQKATEGLGAEPQPTGRRFGLLVAAGLAALTALVWVGRWRPAYEERRLLHAEFRAADFASPATRAEFRQQLKRAVLRHPGDPYFPLIGALAAQRVKDDPLPWIARSLERDPLNGKAHLLLADVLRTRGHLAQALMELRLAVEADPLLIGPAGQRLIGWTQDMDQIARAVPEGSLGTQMLLGMTSHPLAARGAPLRLALLGLMVERDASAVEPRRQVAAELISLIARADDGGKCGGSERAKCIERVRVLEKEIHRADLRSPWPTEIEGELLIALGQVGDAARFLAGRCSATDKPAGCHRLRVVALSKAASSDLEPAIKDYVASACTDSASCAAAETFVGAVLLGRGAPGVALPHFEKAATLQPTPTAWLQVAQVAKAAGAQQRQVLAERRAARLAGTPAAPAPPDGNEPQQDVLDSNAGPVPATK